VIQSRGRFGGVISIGELEDLARAVLMYCLKYYNGDEKIKVDFCCSRLKSRFFCLSKTGQMPAYALKPSLIA